MIMHALVIHHSIIAIHIRSSFLEYMYSLTLRITVSFRIYINTWGNWATASEPGCLDGSVWLARLPGPQAAHLKEGTHLPPKGPRKVFLL